MLKNKDDGYVYIEMTRSHLFRPASIAQPRITIKNCSFIAEEKNKEGSYNLISDAKIKIKENSMYYYHLCDYSEIDDVFIRDMIKLHKRETRKQAVLNKIEG